MNFNKRFVVGIVAFIVLVFILQMRMPREFSWEPTFRHDSTDPFGSMWFDSLMNVSQKGGYSVAEKTFYQIARDSARQGKPCGVLVTSDLWSPDSSEVCQILDFAKQGNVVMIASNRLYNSKKLCDTLDMRDMAYSHDAFSPKYVRRALEQNYSNVFDSVVWVGRQAVFPRRAYRLYSSLITSYFYSYDDVKPRIVPDTLAYSLRQYILSIDRATAKRDYPETSFEFDEDGYTSVTSVDKHLIALSYKQGKGRLVLVSMPLLFTNYAVLNDTLSELTMRLMSEFGDMPVVRTTKFSGSSLDEMRQQSPLRYFVSQPPLRTALYAALVMLLLYMVFNSRRRQRVIPVIKPPANRSLEFMKLIGTLYYERHDNADLLRSKYRGFVDEVRRKTGLDLDDDTDDEQLFDLLSEKTGKPAPELREVVLRLRHADVSSGKVDDKTMMQRINMMNEILTLI